MRRAASNTKSSAPQTYGDLHGQDMLRDVNADRFFRKMAASAPPEDKRFLGQLAATKAAYEKQDWKATMLGCRMLFRIADEGKYLDKIEPLLRPVFDSAVHAFEEARRVARVLRSRIRKSAGKLRQLARLASVLRSLSVVSL